MQLRDNSVKSITVVNEREIFRQDNLLSMESKTFRILQITYLERKALIYLRLRQQELTKSFIQLKMLFY